MNKLLSLSLVLPLAIVGCVSSNDMAKHTIEKFGVTHQCNKELCYHSHFITQKEKLNKDSSVIYLVLDPITGEFLNLSKDAKRPLTALVVNLSNKTLSTDPASVVVHIEFNCDTQEYYSKDFVQYSEYFNKGKELKVTSLPNNWNKPNDPLVCWAMKRLCK